ncbi:MAG: glycosyltransferase family 2 protein [Burkholderiaceae bacterium]
MTTLSIVLPTYNRRETLERSLTEGLRLSQHLPVDYIIIDDGSSDSTADYLTQVAAKDSRVRFQSIENGGPGNARNVGAAMANGDVLLFVGDDSCPTSTEFFETHIRIHEQYREPTLAVLGKMIWPRRKEYPISFVMSMIQGEGGQQFGYAHMRPFARYDWRFFYTCNVSIKRSAVNEWSREGFSSDFRCAAFEDGEFALRLGKKLGKFDVLYAPTSVAEHDHPYNVEGFLGRQFAAGMMANVLVKKHPETAGIVGVSSLVDAMSQPVDLSQEQSQPDQLAVIEGIFASARLTDRSGQLGSQAWHTAFIGAAFELAYHKGIIWSYDMEEANRSAGYTYALELFDRRMAKVVEHEQLSTVAPMTYLNNAMLKAEPNWQRVSIGARHKIRSRLASSKRARSIYHWLKG